MLRTRVIDNLPDLEAMTGAWRDLLDRSAWSEPTLTPLWILTWWRVFGDTEGRRLRVLAFLDEGRLVGLAPLQTRRAFERRVLPFQRLELLASGEAQEDEICSDYLGLLAERGREAEVAAAFAAALLGDEVGAWDELCLLAMSADLPMLRLLADALRARGATVAVDDSLRAGMCRYIPLPATWDTYLKQLDKYQRYGILRALRDLEAWTGPGGYELHRASTPGELEEGKRVLVRLHEELWLGRGQRGCFASERFLRFHEAVMPDLLRNTDGTLDLLWLTARGEPIAALYNIVYAGKTYVYQSGRKEDVPRGIRPGIAVHALAIRRAIELGQHEYDFLSGESLYKKQLSRAVHPLVALRVVSPSLRARALEQARVAAGRAITGVRRVASSLRPGLTPEPSPEPAPESAPRRAA